MSNIVLEVVELKLKQNIDTKSFLSAAEKTIPFLKTLEGFQGRKLSVDADTWIDIVEWDSMDHALNAVELFETAEEVTEFMSMIDFETAKMKHYHTSLII